MLSCQLFVKSSNQQKFDFDYNFKLKLVKLKVISQAAFCHLLPRASRPANLTDIPLHSLSWYHTLKILHSLISQADVMIFDILAKVRMYQLYNCVQISFAQGTWTACDGKWGVFASPQGKDKIFLHCHKVKIKYSFITTK